MIPYTYNTKTVPKEQEMNDIETSFEEKLGIFKEEFKDKVSNVTINFDLPKTDSN